VYQATEPFGRVRNIRHEKERRVERDLHVEAIRALGKIGDPKPVPLFAADWGSLPGPRPGEETTADLDYGAARAKVAALGRIRHKSSVDALLDIWGVGGMHVGVLMGTIKQALRDLLDLDLGHDVLAWKSWWRKNKSGFRFARKK
jgi:hypothetical protein